MNAIAILLSSLLILSLAAYSLPFSGGQSALSPAEQSIRLANQSIEKDPKNYETYNGLAMALARRAREISDVSYYIKAEEALERSFAIKPDNFDGLKAKTWILLGKHEFAQALESAKMLNKRAPDDVLVYGFLADANVELGNYGDAEKAVQWMLDLRPGNLPGLTRAAYLRELFGDVDGAIELMEMAYQSTASSELEDRAWILTQIAHLRISRGELQAAESSLQQALQLFPGYHYALGQLANLRIVQGQFTEAAALEQQRYQSAPHAENLYALAEALEMAGHSSEAKQAFAQFEQKSIAESGRSDNSNHELTFYFVDYVHNPTEALRVAQLEFSRRRDVHTLDAYAWALDANGNYEEARKQIAAALQVGIKDAQMLYHAGVIAAHCKDRAAAERYWASSADLKSRGSDKSRLALASLEMKRPQ